MPRCDTGCSVKSWIEIDEAHLAHNLRVVQQAVPAGTEVLAVIKADGYGHTAALVAQALVRHGATWLGVTDAEEGIEVRRVVGEATRLLVMCGMEASDAAAMVAARLTPVIWTTEHIDALEAACEAAAIPWTEASQRFAVHLEIDTGMARQGVVPGAELERVLARLTASRWLACEGVMSHLSSSEVVGAATTAAQRQRFGAALTQVRAAGVRPALLHLSNTSGVDEGSTTAWLAAQAEALGARAMVRTGLAIFGETLPLEQAGGSATAPHPTAIIGPQLRPVLTWKTPVIGLRSIDAGDTVGYGATFTARASMRLALLTVGYADGFRREASSGMGNGWVMLHGQRAPVVGRVSMNLTIVDVTHIEGVALGDAAVLLGAGVSAQDHARWCGTIAYEILCGLRAHARLV
jgi:alanine racemase